MKRISRAIALFALLTASTASFAQEPQSAKEPQLTRPTSEEIDMHERNVFALAVLVSAYERQTLPWGLPIDILRSVPRENFYYMDHNREFYRRLWPNPEDDHAPGWLAWKKTIGGPKTENGQGRMLFIISDPDDTADQFGFAMASQPDKNGAAQYAPTFFVSRLFYEQAMSEPPDLNPSLEAMKEDFLRSWTDSSSPRYGSKRSDWQLRTHLIYVAGNLARMNFMFDGDHMTRMIACTKTDLAEAAARDCAELFWRFETASYEAICDTSEKLFKEYSRNQPPLPSDIADYVLTSGKKKGIRNYLRNKLRHIDIPQYSEQEWKEDEAKGCVTRNCIWARAWSNHQ